jgi:hypothetical protein
VACGSLDQNVKEIKEFVQFLYNPVLTGALLFEKNFLWNFIKIKSQAYKKNPFFSLADIMTLY